MEARTHLFISQYEIFLSAIAIKGVRKLVEGLRLAGILLEFERVFPFPILTQLSCLCFYLPDDELA